MQFLQKNILLQFKDKLFMYSFFEFRVIYLILYGEVSLGVCVWLFQKKDLLLI